jgi:tetraacyldisaccharide 4'-kinase
MRDPAFWWRKPGLAAGLLSPLSAGYGAIAAWRMAGSGGDAGLPVLCVGNFTLGGAGKTPTVLTLAKMLLGVGKRVTCLTRGYGGSIQGPKLVDADIDGAAQVGDEALLLARVASTIVSRDRVAGAVAARNDGADVVVMDDGLQNASLAKDFTIAVVDGHRGLGNGKVFPAGPLRAPLNAQLERTNALLVVGEDDSAQGVIAEARARLLPVFHGQLIPDPAAVALLKGRKVIAFAGVGDPNKFFATVARAGIDLVRGVAFGDHHRFSGAQAARLLEQADYDGLTLVTTEKDHARMAGEPALAALAARTQVLPVTLVVDEADELRNLVMAKLRQ